MTILVATKRANLKPEAKNGVVQVPRVTEKKLFSPRVAESEMPSSRPELPMQLSLRGYSRMLRSKDA